MKQRKTWREKLADSKDQPRVEPIPEAMASRWGRGTLVIPAPLEVDALKPPHSKAYRISVITA